MRALALGCVALAAGLSLGARAGQAQTGTVTVRVTNYADQSGPTYYGGWQHPAPGIDVVACSRDLPARAVVYIAGYRFVCWDRGSGLGYGSPYTWVDLSVDLGLDGLQQAVITGEIEEVP